MATNTNTAPRQIPLIRSEREWLAKHATFRNFAWFCDETGAQVLMRPIRRSIWDDRDMTVPFAASGEIRIVYHLYCTNCGCPDGSPTPRVEPGSLIEESSLMTATT